MDRKGCLSLPDIEQSHRGEREVAPLVGALNESTDEESDDVNERHEHGCHDVRKSEASDEQQLEQEAREDQEPLDVPNVLSTHA